VPGDSRRERWWARARAELADLRAGVQASWGLSLEPPRREQRLRRLAHAFALPWVVLAIALRDAALRRAYLRTTLPVSILTLALGVFAVCSPWTRSHFRKEPEHHAPTVRLPPPDKLRAQAEKLRSAALRVRSTVGPPGGRASHSEAKATEMENKARELETQARAWEARLDKVDAPDRDKDGDDEEDDDEDEAPRRAHDGGAARAKRSTDREEVAAGLASAISDLLAPELAPDAGQQDADAGLVASTARRNSFDFSLAPEASHPPRQDGGWQWPSLSALYGVLAVIESLLLGFTREHQHQIGRQLCLETGGTPEHDEAPPRVRLEWKWIRKKIRRRIRGTFILASGWVPVTLLAAVPVIGHWLSPAAGALWGFYWLGVFTLGSSHVTWTNDAPGQPAFVRACRAVRPVPLVGWAVGLYGRLWAWLTQDVRPACLTFERAPIEAMGLALARLLSGLPVISGFVRPVVPVAAQLALRDRYAPPGAPSKPESAAGGA
jgi:hypothetical protein